MRRRARRASGSFAGMPPEFAPLAERIVDALLESSPDTARFAGDHRYDDRLPDYSPGAVAGDVAMLHGASVALSQVDDDELDPQDRVDHAVLLARVEQALFELTEIREHEWNPLEHNPGPLLYALIARPFAPAAQRLESLAGRLDAVPDALATARAAAALDEFGDWLRKRLAADEAGRDPRLGRPLWEARLWHTLDTELPAAEVMARAWATLDAVNEELRAEAAHFVGGTADDGTVRAALARLGDDHPDNTTIVELARETLRETTDFVTDHELVSLVDDPCVVQEMPEFARGVAVAYCQPPGPLETAELPTFYSIAPAPADWPAERVESFYREYNNYLVRNLTVHEAMPGHFLQMAHSRRFRGSTRARALGFSGPFVEGWAVYAEELMVRYGFGGPQVRLQQLKMQLRMTLNAIIDQLVHCEGLGETEAMELMTGRGFQEEGEAAGKWRRALLTSTQLSTYFVGYLEVSAIGQARPPDTSVQAWHDAMLVHGSPPPRHLRTLLAL